MERRKEEETDEEMKGRRHLKKGNGEEKWKDWWRDWR